MSQMKQPAPAHQWKPRLKTGHRRRDPLATGSVAAAAMAMASISAIDKRRSRGELVDVAAVERASREIGLATGKAFVAGAPRLPVRSPVRRWPWAVVLVSIAVALAGRHTLGGGSRHSVDGTVMLGRMPLSGVELRFHQGTSGTFAASVITASDGGFRVVDLPTGEYKVTIQASGAAARAVPPAYGKPGSTLFTLVVNRDLERLRMYAVDPARRR